MDQQQEDADQANLDQVTHRGKDMVLFFSLTINSRVLDCHDSLSISTFISIKGTKVWTARSFNTSSITRIECP